MSKSEERKEKLSCIKCFQTQEVTSPKFEQQ